MPTATITKTYLNGNILLESDLDNIRNSITTFTNTILLDNVNIQSGGLLGSNFASSTIQQLQMGAACVTAPKVSSSAVQNYAITNSSILQSAIANLAITNGQIGAKNFVQSASCGNADLSSSTGFSIVTNLSVTITTVGRPVWVGLVSDGSTNPACLLATGISSPRNVQLVRNSPSSAVIFLQSTLGQNACSLYTIDFPSSAGSYVYSVQAKESTVNYSTLIAFEL